MLPALRAYAGGPSPGGPCWAGEHGGQARAGQGAAPVRAWGLPSSQPEPPRRGGGGTDDGCPPPASSSPRRTAAPAEARGTSHHMDTLPRVVPQGRSPEDNARVPQQPGPHASPAHLVLERVVGDVLQVDEHVEIRPKHARLQGLGRHLQQEPGTELAGRTPDSPHPLRPPGPRLGPSRLISSAPGVPRRHRASGGPGRDVQNGGFQPSPPDTDDNPSLTSSSERRKRGPEGGEASRLQAWATAHVPGSPPGFPRAGHGGGSWWKHGARDKPKTAGAT